LHIAKLPVMRLHATSGRSKERFVRVMLRMIDAVQEGWAVIGASPLCAMTGGAMSAIGELSEH